MGEKIVVGPIGKGLRTGIEPFNIDNDSFPTMVNMYQWRERIKRKRGTDLLGRLNRFINSLPVYGGFSITLDAMGKGNILSAFHLQANGDVIPGLTFIDNNTLITYTDPLKNGTLSPSGTINYATGAIQIPAAANDVLVATFFYHPNLPVMGLEELQLTPNTDTGELAFDTTYSYNISTVSPYPIRDVSFYKNPASSGTYVQKASWTPLTWNGQDYQQFWTTNYQGALWATNGMTVPFTVTNIGMQFASPSTTPALSAAAWVNATTMTFTIAGNPLVVGDFVFANEFTGGSGLNFQTGYVTVAGNTFTVIFPNATIANAVYTPGMLQYLTNRSDATKDNIRFYDGSPTDLQPSPTFQTGHGWVNYMPPLSEKAYSIADLPPKIYYLAGAKLILPFKDRLIFFGPVVQASSGNPIYLPDTIVYTQNGTPYYTASFTNDPSPTKDTPTSITNVFFPLLVPDNQTASPCTMFEDQVGFGGFISVGISDRIISAALNEDAIIVGFTKIQTRLISTGNDITPFEFFRVNSELGTGSTFSAITMDQGVLSRGNRGYVLANQVGASRFDLDIPDEVFSISLDQNGAERVTAQRDFINEWVYFTYPSNYVEYKFPNQTLFYNYRDLSFAIFNEAYTTYGTFAPTGGETWATLTQFSWQTWNSAWNAGDDTPGDLKILAGNQQGYVLIRNDDTTEEDPSLYISNISGNTVTSPNHCLNNGDYIIITDAIGSQSNLVNGLIFSVEVPQGVSDTFILNPTINMTPGTYVGGGQITRLYVPFVQTKQFPLAWNLGRKVRIGPQQYLLTTTESGQITVQIYLSQDNSTPYNNGPIVPATLSTNNSLIYSQIVFTCPESTNLGLTPANTNLQMLAYPGKTAGDPSPSPSAQIWHRMNTSLIGDTVQLGFTLSDAQMRDTTLENQTGEIELHGFIMDVSPSQILC